MTIQHVAALIALFVTPLEAAATTFLINELLQGSARYQLDLGEQVITQFAQVQARVVATGDTDALTISSIQPEISGPATDFLMEGSQSSVVTETIITQAPPELGCDGVFPLPNADSFQSSRYRISEP